MNPPTIHKPAFPWTMIEAVALFSLWSLIVLFVFFGSFVSHGGSREYARRIACLQNTRQIALAFQQYAMDHDGEFPSIGNSSAPVTSSSVFLTLTNGNRIEFGKVFLCPGDDGKTKGNPSRFDSHNNSYACVVADPTGRTGLKRNASDDQPLILDRGLIGSPAPVADLTSNRWNVSSPHQDGGGTIVYVDTHASFKKVFDCGADGTNGFILEP